MFTNRLARCVLGTLLVTTFWLAASEVLAQKRGGTLVMITQPEPVSLAGYLATSGPISEVTTKVFDGLLEYGEIVRCDPERGVLSGRFHQAGSVPSERVNLASLELLLQHRDIPRLLFAQY